MSNSVLIVDSDQGFVQSAQDALEALGIEVHVLEDASIDVVRKLRPTIMMLNVELARGAMRGFSICSRIRRDAQLKLTPILLTSSESTPEALEKHSQSPDRANDYALKPIDLDDLITRVGRLLDAAPSELAAAPQNGAASPPGPPPIPPPLPKRGSTDVEAPPPRPTSLEAPPALPREPVAPAEESDIWPTVRFEDEFRQAVQAEPEQKLGRASPDERLAALRTLVKKYQSRDKDLRTVWDSVMQRGQEVARQVSALQLQQHQTEAKLAESLQEKEATEARLESVESEFRTFQDEITRIFKEKDAEEANKSEQVSAVFEENEALKQQLAEAQEAIADDQKRLSILNEELEGLESEKLQVDGLLAETKSGFEDATQELENARARLQMVENVASDRGEEIQTLQDQLDQLALAKNQTEKELKGALEEQLEALRGEHQEAANAFERSREAASDQIRALNDKTAELEAQLAAANAAAFDDSTRLTEEVRALEQMRDGLEDQLEEARTAEATVNATNEALNEEVAELRRSVQSKDKRVAQLEAAVGELEEQLDGAAREATKRIQELEEELDAAQTELFERLAELDHLKKTTAGLEARNKDLETSLRLTEKSLKETSEQAANLEQSFAATSGERSELEEQVSNLEQQLVRLEEKDRETTRMLEEERERYQRAEDLVRKAKEKLEVSREERTKHDAQVAELEAELDALEQTNTGLEERAKKAERATTTLEAQVHELTTAKDELETMLNTEQGARLDAEGQLEGLQTDLSKKEMELSDAYADRTTLQRKLDAASEETNAERASLEAQLEQMRAQAEEDAVQIEGLKRSNDEAGAQIGALTAEVDALRSQVSETSSQVSAWERDAQALAKSEQALKKQVEEKSSLLFEAESSAEMLKRELDRARLEGKKLAEQQHLLKKAAWALEMARRSIPEHFAAEAAADASVAEAVKEPEIFDGAVQPLEGAFDPDYAPPSEVVRSASLVSQLGTSEEGGDNAAPFAALVAEIEASEGLVRKGFDEQFAGEPTNTDTPQLGGAAGMPPDREDVGEEGGVTEIIRLEDLE